MTCTHWKWSTSRSSWMAVWIFSFGPALAERGPIHRNRGGTGASSSCRPASTWYIAASACDTDFLDRFAISGRGPPRKYGDAEALAVEFETQGCPAR